MTHYIIPLLLFSFQIPSFRASSGPGFAAGSRVAIPIPPTYEDGFRGRAFFLEGGVKRPNFRAALSLEALDGSYACSLKVLLGDTVVWASDHFSKFSPRLSCVVELGRDGDLAVVDQPGRIGWRTGTSGQGVEKLQLQNKTGNLVLLNVESNLRWQSFDHPTDVLLWGQRLNATTRLTSFIADSAAFYTFEVGMGVLRLYLNFQDQKYFFWEYGTTTNKSIAYAILGSSGLKLFGANSRKIGQIMANSAEPVRFLALGGTGNLDLYYYTSSTEETEFRSSYRAIDSICNLPLPCGPYQVCSSSSINTCLAIQMGQGNYSGFCDGRNNKMAELENVDTVLKTISPRTDLSKEECVRSCMDVCSCSAAMYSKGSCFRYGIVGGAREVERGNESTYWVKVSEERNESCGMSSSLMNKLLLFGEVVDVVAISLILGGLVYYFLKVRKTSEHSEPDN